MAAILVVTACERGPEPEPVKGEPAPTSARAGDPPASARADREAETQPAGQAPSGDGPSAGGLSWSVPEPLTAREPSSRMRAAEYAIAGAEGKDARLAVFYFGPGQGGSVDDNLERWIGQFQQPGGGSSRQAARIDKRQVHGLAVTTLDLTGTYKPTMPGMRQAAAAPKAGYRVLAAVAEGPRGPVFFKLVGPASVVEHAEEAFDAMIESLEPLSSG